MAQIPRKARAAPLKRKRVTQQNVIDGEVDADVLFASAAKMYKGLKEQNAGLKGELEGVRLEVAALRKEKDELKRTVVLLELKNAQYSNYASRVECLEKFKVESMGHVDEYQKKRCCTKNASGIWSGSGV